MKELLAFVHILKRKSNPFLPTGPFHKSVGNHALKKRNVKSCALDGKCCSETAIIVILRTFFSICMPLAPSLASKIASAPAINFDDIVSSNFLKTSYPPRLRQCGLRYSQGQQSYYNEEVECLLTGR